VAETRRIYAEDKEEEVKLLERSVEELESTINVLENKVSCNFFWRYFTRSLSYLHRYHTSFDKKLLIFNKVSCNYFVQADIIKEEAERQRLQREDLELELHALKDMMQNVKNVGDMRRFNFLCLYGFFILGQYKSTVVLYRSVSIKYFTVSISILVDFWMKKRKASMKPKITYRFLRGS